MRLDSQKAVIRFPVGIACTALTARRCASFCSFIERRGNIFTPISKQLLFSARPALRMGSSISLSLLPNDMSMGSINLQRVLIFSPFWTREKSRLPKNSVSLHLRQQRLTLKREHEILLRGLPEERILFIQSHQLLKARSLFFIEASRALAPEPDIRTHSRHTIA